MASSPDKAQYCKDSILYIIKLSTIIMADIELGQLCLACKGTPCEFRHNDDLQRDTGKIPSRIPIATSNVMTRDIICQIQRLCASKPEPRSYPSLVATSEKYLPTIQLFYCSISPDRNYSLHPNLKWRILSCEVRRGWL